MSDLTARSAGIIHAFTSADTLAALGDFRAAHFYLDLAEALIEHGDPVIDNARQICLEHEISQFGRGYDETVQ